VTSWAQRRGRAQEATGARQAVTLSREGGVVSESGAETLGEVGEFALVDALRARLAQRADVLIGPGDDAAVVRMGTEAVVVSTDLLVEGQHFRRAWSGAVDVGHKAAAQNIADIAAMGGRCHALVLGFGAPGDLPRRWALELADGIADEAALAGASVVGGDVTRAESVLVAVTALGTCAGGPVLRSGARVGDVVAVAGRLGWAAAGLAVLGRGFRSPRVVVEAHQRPHPPYAAGPQAAALGASALIDVSDGLLADLGHVAVESGVAIDVRSAALEVAEPLRSVGAALGVDPLSFVLTGGDDHAFAATFDPAIELPPPWRVIGSVLDGEGVQVDGAPYSGELGHDHFS
jgi:thiamine-monophosphate kinase